MLLRKLGIILSGLIFMRCSNDSKPANYYTYSQIVKAPTKATPSGKDKLSINFKIDDNFKITDTSKTENIKVQVGFTGLLQVFPEDLHFELYANDQKIAIPETIHYTITTVIDNSVRYFKTEENSFDVNAIVDSVKKKNMIPDSVSYFSVAGIIPAIPLNNTHNPPLLKLHLKAFHRGNVIYDQEQAYELKRPTLYKTRSRPFG